MSEKSPSELLGDASAWWSTSLIDIRPGEIGIRGHPIQELIGKLSFPEMIWLMLRGTLPSAEQAKLLEAALGGRRGPWSACAVDRDFAYGGDLRAATQRGHGERHQRAG